MSGRLEGKVALITGGASGLGEATCRLFVEEGAKVVIADVQDERGEGVAKDLGDAAIYQHTDVRHESEIAAAIDRAVEHFGQLDCLFANAGIVGSMGPVDELVTDELDFTLAVNLRGVILCMKHAARVMKPRKTGSILSTSSIAGVHGGLGPHAYAVAKAGLVGLTRNVAAELIRHGIRVNCIAPGNMATEMIAGLITGSPDDVASVEKAIAVGSPVPGRAGLPMDIARAALYLASEDAAFVNGHTLLVDGGVTTGSGSGLNLFESTAPMVREAGKRGLPEG